MSGASAFCCGAEPRAGKDAQCAGDAGVREGGLEQRQAAVVDSVRVQFFRKKVSSGLSTLNLSVRLLYVRVKGAG